MKDKSGDAAVHAGRHRDFKRMLLSTGICLGCLLICHIFFVLLPFPELEAFQDRPYSREILDRDGKAIAVIHLTDGTRRRFVPLEEMPDHVVDALIAGEDRRFYFHFGVDPLAVLRAMAQNIRSGQRVSGASTITMQLARLMLPHSGGLGGKITEALTALRIEARLSKKQILRLYLNNVPFGRGVEGFDSASRSYVFKSVCAVSPAEAVLLSVIPRAPGLYDPGANPERLLEAARRVGARMKNGPDESSLVAALLRMQEQSPAGLAREEKGAGSEVAPAPEYSIAPHFVLRIARMLCEAEIQAQPEVGLGKLFETVESGSIMNPGAPVHSTLDSGIQVRARELLQARLAESLNSRISNGSLIVIENAGGAVRAYIGSPEFFNHEIAGQIDAVQIRRQPGSTLKPFLYGLALDSGYTAATILPDIPSSFGGSEIYVPQNFNRSYSGPVRLRNALASSLNVPAVYLVTRLGVETFTDLLIRLGFDLEDQRDSVGSGIALGNVEVRLDELVRGYTAFVNHGRPLDLVFYAEGKAPAASDPPETGGVFSPGSAGLIRDILSDDAARVVGFGTYRLLDTDFPAFFKTGTANQFSNIWAVGVSPEYTIGVWMGNIHGQTVQGVTGSALPASIVVDLLEDLCTPGTSFPPIPGVHQVRISAISGMAVQGNPGYAIDEYFPTNYWPPEDTWHSGPGASVVYPPEFQPWAMEYGRTSPRYSDSGSQADHAGVWEERDWVRIVSPVDSAVFFPDPYLQNGEQALVVQAVGTGTLRLFYDGELIDRGPAPMTTLIPLERGAHRIEAFSADSKDSITINVGLDPGSDISRRLFGRPE